MRQYNQFSVLFSPVQCNGSVTFRVFPLEKSRTLELRWHKFFIYVSDLLQIGQ